MKTLHVPLLRREEIAENTYSFHFPKMDFTYNAGQYISLCVEPPEIAAPGGTMRELSLSSNPHEKELVTALRFRESKAKQQFLKLKKGDLAYIQGPFGSFELEETKLPIVFLAGGIGITPLLSMVKDALHKKWSNDYYIFSSNRRQEDVPFVSDLQSLITTNKNVQLINTVTLDTVPSLTREPVNNWQEETGYITAAMIKKYVASPKDAFYYLSGPLRFTGGMWDVLDEMGINAKHIHGEEFTGY